MIRERTVLPGLLAPHDHAGKGQNGNMLYILVGQLHGHWSVVDTSPDITSTLTAGLRTLTPFQRVVLGVFLRPSDSRCLLQVARMIPTHIPMSGLRCRLMVQSGTRGLATRTWLRQPMEPLL